MKICRRQWKGEGRNSPRSIIRKKIPNNRCSTTNRCEWIFSHYRHLLCLFLSPSLLISPLLSLLASSSPSSSVIISRPSDPPSSSVIMSRQKSSGSFIGKSPSVRNLNMMAFGQRDFWKLWGIWSPYLTVLIGCLLTLFPLLLSFSLILYLISKMSLFFLFYPFFLLSLSLTVLSTHIHT